MMRYSKEINAPYYLVKQVKELGKLPVPNFSAGGIATPADAALMMQLGAEAVFVGSGIFKSDDPEKRAKAVVDGTWSSQDTWEGMADGMVVMSPYNKKLMSSELIQEAIKIKDPELKTYVFEHIAQQMKRSYLNWNQTNVQDVKIWDDLEQFANQKVEIDKTKIIPVFQTTQYTRKKPFYKKSNKKNYSRK